MRFDKEEKISPSINSREEIKRLQTELFLMRQDFHRLTTQMVESERVSQQRHAVLQSEIERLNGVNEELTSENEELVAEIQDVMHELERSYEQLNVVSKENETLKENLTKAINERDEIAERFFDEVQNDTLTIKEQLQQVRNEERAKVAAIAAEEKLAEQYLEIQKIENDKLRSQVEYLQALLKDAHQETRKSFANHALHEKNQKFEDARMAFLREHKETLLTRKASKIRRNKIRRNEHCYDANHSSSKFDLSASSSVLSVSSSSSGVKKMASSLVKSCTNAVSYLTENGTTVFAPAVSSPRASNNCRTGAQGNRSLSMNHLVNSSSSANAATFTPPRSSRFKWKLRSDGTQRSDPEISLDGGSGSLCICDGCNDERRATCSTSNYERSANEGVSTLSTLHSISKDLKTEALRESVYSYQGLSTSDMSEQSGMSHGFGDTIVDFNPELREKRRARSVPDEEFLYELSESGYLKAHSDCTSVAGGKSSTHLRRRSSTPSIIDQASLGLVHSLGSTSQRGLLEGRPFPRMKSNRQLLSPFHDKTSRGKNERGSSKVTHQMDIQLSNSCPKTHHPNAA